MSDAYRIQVASDPDHERVYAEIYQGERFVALVSQEGDPPALRLELPGPGLDEALVQRAVELDAFLAALEQARRRLQEG